MFMEKIVGCISIIGCIMMFGAIFLSEDSLSTNSGMWDLDDHEHPGGRMW
jgi:hypothetical protein